MNHISVFKNEIVENLGVKATGTYVDLTLGAGGHSADILQKLKGGTLIAFDLEEKAIELFKQNNSSKVNEIHLVNRNFGDLAAVLSELEITAVDGIIADLGWSSEQLERISGLSYREEDKGLDMRFDENLGVTARDLLNALGRRELLVLFERYADIRGGLAQSLVDQILLERKFKPFDKVRDLVKVINKLTNSSRGKANFASLAARVFQALRIAVNSELSALQSLLPQAFAALAAGGTLQIITFHSGEERLVDEFCQQIIKRNQADRLYPTKFLQPSTTELRSNIRAHSAKLWGIRKA